MLTMRHRYLTVAGLLVIAVVGAWIMRARDSERSRSGESLLVAMSILQQVQTAESNCFRVSGYYADLSALGSNGCGGLRNEIVSGYFEGFNIAIHVKDGRYSLSIHPASIERFYSLFLDESGVVHLGTRQDPATIRSRPLEYVPSGRK